MRSLTLRIYLTVLAALALFALASGWLVQRHLASERAGWVHAAQQRSAAWAELLQNSLPPADAPAAEQAAALAEWSARLRLPLALDDAHGQRIGASASFRRRAGDAAAAQPIRLDDGRTLWLMRAWPPRGPRPAGADDGPRAGRGAGHPPGPGFGEAMHGGDADAAWTAPGPAAPAQAPLAAGAGAAAGGDAAAGPDPRLPGEARPGQPRPALRWPLLPAHGLPGGIGLAALLLVLFAAVALGAWPVARRLTRRLQALKQGVEAFGAGALHQRVAEDGNDEVAAVAVSFNRAAARIEALLRAHRSLLANASHELRSPLARLRMALAMLDDAAPSRRDALRREIEADIAELDALVEEVLLASRLDAAGAPIAHEPLELLALAAEEAARFDLQAGGDTVELRGDERLLRRALRNLLENARRYGGGEVQLTVRRSGSGAAARAELAVCDRGPGVPEAYRERIFEPFFRLPGHAEREGGVGLGLALVRQIVERHGGTVACAPRAGGGSCFSLSLPLG